MTEPMLKNGANKDEPKKADSIVLSEEDSLRCENLDLRSQLLRLNRKVAELERVIDELDAERQKNEKAAFLKKLGVGAEGRVLFVKRPDGRYEIAAEPSAEKK